MRICQQKDWANLFTCIWWAMKNYSFKFHLHFFVWLSMKANVQKANFEFKMPIFCIDFPRDVMRKTYLWIFPSN